MPNLAALRAAIEGGQVATATRMTQDALDEGMDPREVLAAMIEAMDEVGARFQRHETYVPEMLLSARTMKESMALLEPALTASGIQPGHVAVVGTIEGDLHDIGKNLVAMMWKGANIGIVDLGTNVAPARFATAAREHGASIVGISALLMTTMVGMRDAVSAVRAAGLPHVKVIVGGAPVTAEFASSIGADGYAPDAAAAVDVARQLLGVSQADE